MTMENKFVIKLCEDVCISKEVYKNIFSGLMFSLDENKIFEPRINKDKNLIFNKEYMSLDKYVYDKQEILKAANDLYIALNKKYDLVNRKIVLDIFDLYEKLRDVLERHYKIILEENGDDLSKPDVFYDVYYEPDEKINNKLKSQEENLKFWSNIRKRWYYILSWFFIVPGLIFEIFRHVKLKNLSKINKTDDKNLKKLEILLLKIIKSF